MAELENVLGNEDEIEVEGLEELTDESLENVAGGWTEGGDGG